MAEAMAVAVEKSGRSSTHVSVARPRAGVSTARLTVAPSGTSPVTAGFGSDFSAGGPPSTGPCAEAYTCPSGPRSRLSIRIPPASDVASPMEATRTSRGSPERAMGGRLAVTATTATLRALAPAAVAGWVVRPKRVRTPAIIGEVRAAEESPVPGSPTTRP